MDLVTLTIRPRSAHPTDRRATVVTLTEQGGTTLAQLNAEYQQGASDLFASSPRPT